MAAGEGVGRSIVLRGIEFCFLNVVYYFVINILEVGADMPQQMLGGQRTTLWGSVSPRFHD